MLVFATPTYFLGPSAQIKSLLDRMYSLAKFNASKGGLDHNLGHLKMAVIATAGGGIQPGLQLIQDTFKTIAAGLSVTGFDSLLVPNAPVCSEDMKQDRDLQERAKAFGRTLAS
jgi:multimeric flavodoxin WrbA